MCLKDVQINLFYRVEKNDNLQNFDFCFNGHLTVLSLNEEFGLMIFPEEIAHLSDSGF